ncbi:MAG: cupin domain-containing protein [Anaerolineales bacterium]|nr:MAG: cupin domain-containing protein [Anaerolineales bacterium]
MPYMNLSEFEAREIIPGYRAIFLHSENMTLAYWTISAGSAMPVHSHPHEQVANILEGEFELVLDGEARVLRPGMVAMIPPDVPHGGLAISECRILDVFHPVREDYRIK